MQAMTCMFCCEPRMPPMQHPGGADILAKPLLPILLEPEQKTPYHHICSGERRAGAENSPLCSGQRLRKEWRCYKDSTMALPCVCPRTSFLPTYNPTCGP